MTRFAFILIPLVLATPLGAATAESEQPAATQERFDLPMLKDGRRVIAFDPHMHTIFSDGLVWPTVRVDEAREDNVAAIAITDHVEWHPHLADVPNPDLNRSSALAKEAGTIAGVTVVRGAEITRGAPPGHLNVLFLKDINPLLTVPRRSVGTSKALHEQTAGDMASVDKALRIAKGQGAFTFINHPYWPGYTDGVARLPPETAKLISEGLIDGIEVANGHHWFKEAIQFALDHNLAFMGSSDLHKGLTEEFRPARGESRTVTLLLAKDASEAAVREALDKRATAALFEDNILGREPIVREIVVGALQLYVAEKPESSEGVRMPDAAEATIVNSSSIAFTLRYSGNKGLLNTSDLFQIPAHSCRRIFVKAIERGNRKGFRFEVLNSATSPEGHATVDLTAEDHEKPAMVCKGSGE